MTTADSMREPVTGTVDAALGHAARLIGSDPALALAQARAVSQAVPGHPQASLIEGRALRQLGHLAEARACLARLARAQPRSADTAFELGRVEAALGEGEAAIVALRRAVTLRPEFPQAWSALAAALRLQGDEGEADRADLAAIRAATRDPLLIEAALALSKGELHVAEPLLRGRLKARPGDVAATRMLGELAARLGRIDDAVVLLRRALTLAPGFVASRELLARVLSRANRPSEALAEAELLLAGDPENPSHAMLKASVLVRIGDQEGAHALYERLVARHPKQTTGWISLGHVLKTIGRQADAIAAYRRAIALVPTLGEVWWSLANLKTVKLTAGDIAAMRAALEVATSAEDRFHLHFALGKALEDAGADAAAFAAYTEGNRLRREMIDYDADELHGECERAKAVFTPTFLAAHGGGCAAPDPIFIVGLPRSGSTLIEQILSSHSQVEGTMELPDLMMMAARLEARRVAGAAADYPAFLGTFSADERAALGQEYLDRTRIHRRTDRPFFIDKMPNNWQHVGLIRLILPNAKIIDARRHPLGCCLSGWKQHFARGQGFSYDLGDIGRYYRDYVSLMAAFDEAAPGRVHRVIYEDMVVDTRGQVVRLLDYLGLPFEEGCLAFWRNDRAVRTASSEQVRQPIFTDGVDHWRRFEPWLGPLVAALGPVLAAYPGVPRGI